MSSLTLGKNHSGSGSISLRAADDPQASASAPIEKVIARESQFVALIAALLGTLCFAYCARHNLLLLYGDAVAHLHIARRVFRFTKPWISPTRFGMASTAAFAADSFCSAHELVAERVGGRDPFHRLLHIRLRRYLPPGAALDEQRPAALAAAIYGLNPGLLYMQTTAMTEPLFLAEMIWSTFLIIEFCRVLARGILSREEDHRAGQTLDRGGTGAGCSRIHSL